MPPHDKHVMGTSAGDDKYYINYIKIQFNYNLKIGTK